MQNDCHGREVLHISAKKYAPQKFFCEYFGMLCRLFFIFISSGRRKNRKNAQKMCVFDKKLPFSLRFGKMAFCYNNSRRFCAATKKE